MTQHQVYTTLAQAKISRIQKKCERSTLEKKTSPTIILYRTDSVNIHFCMAAITIAIPWIQYIL